jgi:ketosteroid isomerase-like protein
MFFQYLQEISTLTQPYMQKQILTALILVSISCSQQEPDTKQEGERLMETSREWSKVAATNDIDKIVSYWTDDAVMLSAGEPVLKGKDQLRQMVESGASLPGFQISWEPESAEISRSGDLGYLLENTTMVMPDSMGNTSSLNFKAVTVWRKEADGNWKCAVDVLSPLPNNQAQ